MIAITAHPLCSEADFRSAGHNAAIRRSLMVHLLQRRRTLQRLSMGLWMSVTLQLLCLCFVAFLYFNQGSSASSALGIVTSLLILAFILSFLGCFHNHILRSQLDLEFKMMAMMEGMTSQVEELKKGGGL